VSDLQQAMLSSRRQSMFPLVPPRPTSPYLSSFHWHQNSSATQPIRRPSEAYQPITGRRFSCDPRLPTSGHNVPVGRASPKLRRSPLQSEKSHGIIQETNETSSPVQWQQTTFDDDYQNIDSSNLPGNLSDNNIRHYSLGSFSCFRGGIHSSSTRFRDTSHSED
jgi:hypothetical protein